MGANSKFAPVKYETALAALALAATVRAGARTHARTHDPSSSPQKNAHVLALAGGCAKPLAGGKVFSPSPRGKS